MFSLLIYRISSCIRFRTVSGNRKFIEELTKWTFQEKGVLDVVAVQHHKVGEEEAPAHYRIKDNMVRTMFAIATTGEGTRRKN